MTRNLSVELRPNTFSSLVGLDAIVSQIKKQLTSGRLPTAWMFVGPAGAGKTTIARILSLAVQCTHGDFVDPCSDCIARKADFEISEINASDMSGVDEMRALLQSTNYMPLGGRYRVFILDEAQSLSTAAQNLLLKAFEDAPGHVMWIISTTNPNKILKPLKSRCLSFQLPTLTKPQIRELLENTLTAIGESVDVCGLTDALAAADAITPRFAIMALEKLLTGASIEECVFSTSATSVNSLDLCRATVKGDWNTARSILAEAAADDAVALRIALSGYFKSVLLKSDGNRARVCSTLISRLTDTIGFEPGLQIAALCSAVFDVCESISTR